MLKPHIMWADRIAIGTYALLSLFLILAFSEEYDSAKKDQVSYQAEQTKAAEIFNSLECVQYREGKRSQAPKTGLPSDELEDYLTNIGCISKTPEEIQTDEAAHHVPTIYNFASQLINGGLRAILPLWVVLRILDFMFGGVDRRKKHISSAN